MGIDETGAILVTSHTFSTGEKGISRIRIISSRKATKREKKQYEEGI
jgi:uncharacterized DUF497 family protein